MNNLRKMINPESVALIGAHEKEGSVARPILLNLANSFTGAFFPVNPGLKMVLGRECFSSIAEVPQTIDTAVIVVRAPVILDTIRQCAEAGVKGAVIISTGFGHNVARNTQLKKELLEIRQRFGIRMIGPGSVGIIRPDIGLNTSFLNVNPKPGNIAFISQSGELGDATLKWGIEAGIGFSTFISLGSMIDVDFGEIIDILGDDLSTRSILLSMEYVRNARRFMSAARGFARTKPIIVLKPGRFPESTEAAVSPAETPWGDDEVYDAAFKRAGVVRVGEARDLFNAAQVLDSNYVPAGPRLAILGNVGTVGVMATDLLIERGGSIAKLSSENQGRIFEILANEWNGRNPIDLGGGASAAQYREAIGICLDDPSVDAVLVIYTPHATTIAEEIAKAITEFSTGKRKPILVSLIGDEEMKKAGAILHRRDVPTYGTAEEAVRTYFQMLAYKKRLELLYETPEDLPVDQTPPKNYLKMLIRQAVNENTPSLPPERSLPFLATYGIPVRDPAAISRGSTDSTCQTDYGLYLSMTRDKNFGSVIRFGMAGLGRTVFKDRAVALPPLNQTLARRLIEESRARDMMVQAAAGKTPVELTELERIIVNFSNLIVDFPEIAAMDVEPLSIADGKITANNAEIFLDREEPPPGKTYPHLVITPYPVRYVRPWRLKDGQEIMLRPVRPEDEPLILDLFGSLSEATARERFFSPIKDWTHHMLTRFCNIDYDREIVIVAEVKEGEKKMLRGASSLVLGGGQKSEFAVLVHDDYQGKALGWKLIDMLIGIGLEKGVEEIHGTVLTENTRMLRLLRRLNFRTSLQPLGITDVTLRLR
ncbi:MAG: Acetyl-CoA synthetase / acetyltransferase family protein [Deltaproteobacteria bacterium]|nr:Acetyl-CoA synthetase / acetyltransferase family protein [Deltaproteobacteria bacterium]